MFLTHQIPDTRFQPQMEKHMRIINALLLSGLAGTLVIASASSVLSEKTFIETFQIGDQARNLYREESQKLPPQYCVGYGNLDAPIKIVEFFSFLCPHSIKLFRNEFAAIKKNLIETGKVYYEFHPIPHDLTTAQAMICLEQLEATEKLLFLERMIEESRDSSLMAKHMMAMMNSFKKPVPLLDNHNFLQDHKIFEEIYHFLKQKKILAVPTVEINGQLFDSEIPDYRFIASCIKN